MKDHMAEMMDRFEKVPGGWMLRPNGRIRHAGIRDKDGVPACPLVALYKTETGQDCANTFYTKGMAHALSVPKDLIDDIILVADNEVNTRIRHQKMRKRLHSGLEPRRCVIEL